MKAGAARHRGIMRKTIFTILAVVLFAASPAFAQPLYQDFERGASEADVLSRFSSAKLDEHNSTDSIHAYRMEGYPAAGMWTYFTFNDGGLSKVKFYGRGAAEYLQIVEGLKSRYGKPNSETSAADSGVAIWKRDTTTITARLERSYSTVVGPVKEPFSVTYEPSGSGLESAL